MVIPGSVPEIALDQVGKRFRNGATALEGISLNVERGEFVTFLGPSGCGKSTLLKLVSGLSSVSDGTGQVNGMTPKNARQLIGCASIRPNCVWRLPRTITAPSPRTLSSSGQRVQQLQGR